MMKIDCKKMKYYKLIDIVYIVYIDIDIYYKENFYKLQFLILIRVKINKRS